MVQKVKTGRTLKVLSLEDSPRDFEIIKELLIDAGYDLHMDRVDTEKEFISASSTKEYDIILADFKLPGFDAFAALRLATEICPDVPFICVSGSIGEETAIEIIKQGAVDYVLKDRPERLPFAVSWALDQANETKARKKAEDALIFNNIILRTQQESSIDGILVVDENGGILSFNQRFVDLWDIPLDVLSPRSDERALQSVMDKLADPEEFIRKVKLLYESRNETSRDEIFLRDGRCFDRYSAPMLDANRKYYGRVWYFRDITDRKQAEEELKDILQKLRLTLSATVQAMAIIVETRDPYTAGHQKRVASLATAIAQEMGVPKDVIEGIRVAGLIHDIGKISVPAEILSKPTKLTDMEFSIIKVHPEAGYNILRNIDFPWPVADIVLQHHERLDGSGYPQGLKNRQILLEAKILTVADVVEAMASHRPYRAGLGIDFALDEIGKNRDVLYEARIVNACGRLLKEKGFSLDGTES